MSENTIPFIFHDENGKVVDPAASDIQVYALSLGDKSIPHWPGREFYRGSGKRFRSQDPC